MSTEPARGRDLRELAAVRLPAAIADLASLVRIPSIAWPSFDPDQVRRSADAVAALAEKTGVFDRVRVVSAVLSGTDVSGSPAVLATRSARRGRPTVLLYAHHDVQPTGDEARWSTPPFEPTVIGGRLYGRGAADDKAGVLVHLTAVRALLDALGDDLDLGIVLFIEGEEEYGSPSFSSFLRTFEDDLRSDVIVVADSGNTDASTPALTVSLRGNARFVLTVRTLTHASHSGMFGGAVPDAMTAAIRLLATLWEDDGAVAVSGLEAHVGDTPSESESESESAVRREAGLRPGVSLIGHDSIASRIWHQPAITVTGIDAPSVATASNTLAPEVSVVVSVRVAPGQHASEAFAAVEEHLRAHAPFGAELEFSDVDLGDGFLVDADSRSAALARDALSEGYGAPAVDIGVGGSIPFISEFARVFPDAEILVTGIEDPDTRAHSPDESLHLPTFRHAVVSEAILLERLNAAPRGRA